ncbi:AAA family ATPase [Idiomarina xiamenensis]|uniref:SPOR domain-containing protein n=1 Tax=Idiomarina xiamenensis 10-D-4 TaxID=740709 RepID=K2KTA4_9GAMM|nr:AAA family ATPase [Idiomarina xiamenensis]EKE80875.1 hypothetical protein A10D4_10824 [Idiomarina xiamenensis 10-D-4]
MQAVTEQTALLAAPVKNTASQQRVLERLHYLSNFSQQLLILHGPQGAGKSTLLELYLEQASEYAEVAYVIANARSKVSHLRTQLLTQLYGTVAVSDAPLATQLQRQRSLNHAAIVIDDAELLPTNFIAELQQALQTMRVQRQQKFTIIIAASSQWARQQRAPNGNASSAELVQVEPFDRQEQVLFANSLLPDKLRRRFNAERILQQLQGSDGYPGDIQQRMAYAIVAAQARASRDEAEQPSAESTTASASSAASEAAPARRIALRWVLLSAALLALAMAAYVTRDLWGMASTSTTTLKNTRNETPSAATTAAENHSNDANAADTESNRVASLAEPLLTEQQLELLPEDLSISYNSALGDLQSAAERYQNDGKFALSWVKQRDASNADSAQTTTHNDDFADLPLLPSAIVDNAWVAAQAPQHYAVQLMITSDQASAEAFVGDSQLAPFTRIYRKGQGPHQYVIIYGRYDNVDAARQAANALPAAIQRLSPWPKSFAAMQAEMH